MDRMSGFDTRVVIHAIPTTRGRLATVKHTYRCMPVQQVQYSAQRSFVRATKLDCCVSHQTRVEVHSTASLMIKVEVQVHENARKYLR